MKKVMQKRNPLTGKYVVDFIACLSQFEDRFLGDEEKALLLAILDSLARGKRIQVKR